MSTRNKYNPFQLGAEKGVKLGNIFALAVFRSGTPAIIAVERFLQGSSSKSRV
jgi:hypothetical protein